MRDWPCTSIMEIGKSSGAVTRSNAATLGHFTLKPFQFGRA
jgi:hypothetical protein